MVYIRRYCHVERICFMILTDEPVFSTQEYEKVTSGVVCLCMDMYLAST